ncbi:hypothetical protein [Geminisphaera colitermitum]|uniref:hypothetical protein n=1 Tax=Geminisphaera colitermitum TaxID=1148786 RepID=UPI00019655D0|nr:hypothetical protein [Geminisphaera colitermitum]
MKLSITLYQEPPRSGFYKANIFGRVATFGSRQQGIDALMAMRFPLSIEGRIEEGSFGEIVVVDTPPSGHGLLTGGELATAMRFGQDCFGGGHPGQIERINCQGV